MKRHSPEKQANVKDVDMTEMELTAQAATAAGPVAGAAAASPAVPQEFYDAAAAIEVETGGEDGAETTQETEKEPGEVGDDEEEGEDEDGGSEVSQDLTTHYHHVTDLQSGLDQSWLVVLWSYQDNKLQSHYRWEAFEQWNKVNEKAAEVNAELVKRGQPTLPPTKMFPQVYDHLSTMGLGILTDTERETGYGDPDLKDRLMQCLKEWDRESRQVARDKKAANAK